MAATPFPLPDPGEKETTTAPSWLISICISRSISCLMARQKRSLHGFVTTPVLRLSVVTVQVAMRKEQRRVLRTRFRSLTAIIWLPIFETHCITCWTASASTYPNDTNTRDFCRRCKRSNRKTLTATLESSQESPRPKLSARQGEASGTSGIKL